MNGMQGAQLTGPMQRMLASRDNTYLRHQRARQGASPSKFKPNTKRQFHGCPSSIGLADPRIQAHRARMRVRAERTEDPRKKMREPLPRGKTSRANFPRNSSPLARAETP